MHNCEEERIQDKLPQRAAARIRFEREIDVQHRQLQDYSAGNEISIRLGHLPPPVSLRAHSRKISFSVTGATSTETALCRYARSTIVSTSLSAKTVNERASRLNCATPAATSACSGASSSKTI